MNERERLELLMRCYSLSPSQFADRTGIQRASVSHILSGRNKPSLEVMLKIYDAFPGIDMKWLMTGIGEEPAVQSMQNVVAESAEELFSTGANVVERPAMAGMLFQPIEPVHSVAEPEGLLQDATVSMPRAAKVRQQRAQPRVEGAANELRARKATQVRAPQAAQPAPEKRIKEIRVYYSDGTYEILVPER